jgi:hypothetical protein
MISNEIVVNYKIVDLIEYNNFGLDLVSVGNSLIDLRIHNKYLDI